jgi:hypothetical protein
MSFHDTLSARIVLAAFMVVAAAACSSEKPTGEAKAEGSRAPQTQPTLEVRQGYVPVAPGDPLALLERPTGAALIWSISDRTSSRLLWRPPNPWVIVGGSDTSRTSARTALSVMRRASEPLEMSD